MHVLIGLVVLGLLAYFFLRLFATRPVVGGEAQEAGRDNAFAFLSNGLVFARAHGGPIVQVHSAYAQEADDRRERSRERQSWKDGTAFNISAGGGRRSFDAADKPLTATGVAFEPGGDLLYFLHDDHMGGLFRREAASGKELRLVIKQGLHLTDLCPTPDGARIAASSQQSRGVANIAILDREGGHYREVTGGDTVDSAPAWVPGAPQRILFQSAGLARNEQGHILALGNTSIQQLELESGALEPLLEDPAFDHLKPRVLPSGELLFIRRPYEASTYGSGSMLIDMLLFPFRLLRAIFHYLNFFSLMYSRKPLTSADGPAAQADIKSIVLQGRRVDIEKNLRSARPVGGVPSLVPDSWQLIARERSGAERVLATNVASYDLAQDGTIFYSNGRGVFALGIGGAARVAVAEQPVSELVVATA